MAMIKNLIARIARIRTIINERPPPAERDPHEILFI